ncbi:MAG TPA: MopE-related protein [Thermoanaerobaculia bacterium]|nr:MopE-related protein [Thermoanaerobaculia bacterium]
MIKQTILAAGVLLVFGSAVVAQQQQWYPAPNPVTEAKPPMNPPATPGYPAPGNPQPSYSGTTPAQPNGSKGTTTKPMAPATTPSTKPQVPLIDRVEDAKNATVQTLRGVTLTTPLTQGRSWRIYTRGVEGGAGGRQFWLKREKIAPVKLRTERWDEGEMIVALPAESIAANGTYRLELHQDGSLLAARTVQVVASLPEDFDQDGAGRDRDCDDFDARRHPGATEVCDEAGLDEDCDRNTVLGEKAYVDVDGDGAGAGEAILLCDRTKIGKGFALLAGDCNDHDAKTRPGAGCR